jgi:hypothetical protein
MKNYNAWLRWATTIILVFVLAMIITLLDSSQHSATASSLQTSQSDITYLPIVRKAPKKQWSGMHMGNRNGGLWETGMLDAIDPRDDDGLWPAVVVALSDQIYAIQRNGPNCTISGVTVNPNAWSSGVFLYLRAAAQSGVKVIIRLYPSPGNFTDYNDPNWSNHILSSGPPVGGDYCSPNDYRSPLDLALEMKGIQQFTKFNYNFEIFGFMPANEPNLEWYTDAPAKGDQWSNPNVTSSVAWQDMDNYFAVVYDQVQTIKGGLNIRVLTPTMSPNLFAEGKDFFSVPLCADRLVDNEFKGYDLMPITYGTKNDGVAWHNYWIEGREIYSSCEAGGGHVSYYFPEFIKSAIHPYYKPPIIAEADIGSPRTAELPNGQIPEELTNLLDKDANPGQTSLSVRHFFHSELCYGGGSHYLASPVIAAWLLSDNLSNAEHDWHEAYRDGPIERPWFNEWWNVDNENFYVECP